jgi:hypothetical protein
MKTLYPSLRLTDPSFNYVSSAKTDIRDTFRRFQPPKVQDLKEPLVEPSLPLGGFVLSADWFEVVG